MMAVQVNHNYRIISECVLAQMDPGVRAARTIHCREQGRLDASGSWGQSGLARAADIAKPSGTPTLTSGNTSQWQEAWVHALLREAIGLVFACSIALSTKLVQFVTVTD